MKRAPKNRLTRDRKHSRLNPESRVPKENKRASHIYKKKTTVHYILVGICIYIKMHTFIAQTFSYRKADYFIKLTASIAYICFT